MLDLGKMDTEKRNERTMHIDEMSTSEIVALINSEDHRCAEAVKAALPEIAQAVDIIYGKLHNGGRLIYCGAGTSGRLGILDASECPPTYGVDSSMVMGLIAGGPGAIINAVEGAEDDAALGVNDLRSIEFGAGDVLVGIAASGRTPYVIGAMDYAHEIGAPVIALVCCSGSEMSKHADVTIAAVPGPEVVTGSSRMKSGTCQKMVLNILSTSTMIKLGKVYGNLMVDVRATNEKLRKRALSIVRSATGTDEGEAQVALDACGHSCKTAIVMILAGMTADEAAKALKEADGRVAGVLAAKK